MEMLFLNIDSIEVLILFVVMLVSLIPLLFVIAVIIDVLKRDFEERRKDKILIILLVVFAPIIGSIVYFLIIKNHYPLKGLRYEYHLKH